MINEFVDSGLDLVSKGVLQGCDRPTEELRTTGRKLTQEKAYTGGSGRPAGELWATKLKR